MMTPEWCATMARYNAWQNVNLYTAAETLDIPARALDRGAFFASIHGTLSHVLWADTIWMSRFSDWKKPRGGIATSPRFGGDWNVMARERRQADAAIVTWAEALSADDLAGDLTWYSGALGADAVRPRALCVAHMFNHQTHHRGQVHAMLTAAGASPGDTDLFMLPDPDGA